MTNLSVPYAESSDNRSRSSSIGGTPTPHKPDEDGEPSRPILYPIEPSTKKKTFHLPLGSPGSPHGGSAAWSTTPQTPDPERQPLLNSTPTNRRRTAIPIVVGFFLVIIGLVVGAYALGQMDDGDDPLARPKLPA